MPRTTAAQAFVAKALPDLFKALDNPSKPHKEGPAFDGSSNCLANIERDYARRNGGHWFDADTIRFFRTTFPSGFWDVPAARVTLFVTGERNRFDDTAVRRYSVRAYIWDAADIETLGDFNETTLRVADQAVPLIVAALKERAAA